MIHKVDNWEKDGLYFPSDATKPEIKKNNPAYSLAVSKYIYNEYYNGRTLLSFTDAARIDWLRTYAAGKQSPEYYKDWLLGKKRSNQGRRKGWANVNFDNILSPMPKYLRKLEGTFLNQDHEIIVSAIDERSGAEKEDMLLKQKFFKEFSPQLEELKKAIPGFENTPIATNNEEVEIYSKIIGFKLPYEIAATKLLNHTNDISKKHEVKKRVIRDLCVCNKAAVLSYVNENSQKALYRYIDVRDVIAEYSTADQYTGTRFIAYQDFITVAEAKKRMPHMSTKDLESMAEKYCGMFGNPQRWDNITFGVDGYPLYYTYRIPILVSYWKTVDIEDEEKLVEINPTKVRKGEVESGKILKYGDKYMKKVAGVSYPVENVYTSGWIVGTEYVFEYGLMNDMIRNEDGSVDLPITIYKIEGASMVESCITNLDNIQMVNLRLQDAWSKAAPKGVAIDLSFLADIDFGEGKMSPSEIIDMYVQSGNYVYKSKTDGKPYLPGDKMNYGAPFKETDGGLGSIIEDAMKAFEMNYRQISEMTGIDRLSAVSVTPNNSASVGVTQMAVAATNDVLRPYYDGWLFMLKDISEKSLKRIQVIVEYNKNKEKGYYKVLNEVLYEALLVAGKTPYTMFGISVKPMPTDEMKQEIRNAAIVALQAGKDGVPLITMSDYMFIMDKLNSGAGYEDARVYLSYKEGKAKEANANNAAMMAQLQAEQKRASDAAMMELTAMNEKIKADNEIRVEFAKALSKVFVEGGVKDMSAMYDQMAAAMKLEGYINPQGAAPQGGMPPEMQGGEPMPPMGA